MSQQKIQIKFSMDLIAPVYRPLLHNRSRFLVLYGGAGSGKSYFAVQKMLYRILSEEDHKFLVVRQYYSTIKETIYEEIRRMIERWKLEKLFEFRLSPLEIRCLNGNRIIFQGMDDPEKLKSISGVTSVMIEEATELTKEGFDQLTLRVRGKHLKNYVQFMICFNPISEHHWLKKRFFDYHDDEATVVKTTYLDNPFLDEAYIKQMEKLKDINPDYYRIYALGEWGTLGKLVFTNYQVKEISTNPDDYEVVYSGVDFGWNDPSAYVRVGVKDNELYIIDELYERELTNAQLIEKIKQKQRLDDWLVCDSAEPDRILEFKRAGFTKVRPATKGKGSIKSGIDKIKQHKIYISPRCKNFIMEIEQYTYKQDKEGNVYDEPVDENNHLMDAFRYAMELKRKQKIIKPFWTFY